MSNEPDSYYYVDGGQVALEPTRHHAIDFSHPALTELSKARISQLKERASPLRRGVMLLHDEDLTEDEEQLLDEAGALLPVYLSDGALIIVLPEVRIEGHSKAQQTAVKKFVMSADVAPRHTKGDGAMMSVVPSSGRAVDALKLANRASEKLGPRAAQARFIRVVPKS